MLETRKAVVGIPPASCLVEKLRHLSNGEVEPGTMGIKIVSSIVKRLLVATRDECEKENQRLSSCKELSWCLLMSCWTIQPRRVR